MNVIDTIIFDLDDTLYPEKEFVIDGFSAVADYINKYYTIERDRVFDILQSDFNKGLRKKNFNVLLEKLKIDENIIQELIQIYREHKPTITLYPDAEKILKILKQKKKLGLITDGIPKTQQNKINALNLKNYFDEIIINDITKTNKLNPNCFKKIIKLLDTTYENSIYIGDNPLKDFYIPKKLGMKTIQIKRKKGEYFKNTVDNKYGAEITINSLTELPRLLNLV